MGKANRKRPLQNSNSVNSSKISRSRQASMEDQDNSSDRTDIEEEAQDVDMESNCGKANKKDKMDTAEIEIVCNLNAREENTHTREIVSNSARKSNLVMEKSNQTTSNSNLDSDGKESLKVALPELCGLVPIMKESYLRAHKACLRATEEKNFEQMDKERAFMLDTNSTIRMMLSTINSLCLDSKTQRALGEPKMYNQIVTQLIISTKIEGKNVTDFVQPSFIYNLDGNKDLVAYDTSLIGFFVSRSKAEEAMNHIKATLEEQNCLEFEFFSHSKFIIRSSYFPVEKIKVNYQHLPSKGDLKSKITKDAIRKAFLQNTRIFPNEHDLIDLKIMMKDNRDDASNARFEIMVTLKAFDKAKTHPKDSGTVVHLIFNEFKVTLYNQYYPKVCSKCFKSSHPTNACPQPIAYCTKCGHFHPGSNCPTTQYECPTCREEDGNILNHKPISFNCPHFRRLSYELQLKHYEAKEGFASLMELI